MVTIGGLDARQIGVLASAAAGLIALAIWRGWPAIQRLRARGTIADAVTAVIVPQPDAVVSDSDRPAPPGTKQWIREILAAVDGAPDALRLEILLDGSTTVATAQRRYIEYLRATPAAPPADPVSIS